MTQVSNIHSGPAHSPSQVAVAVEPVEVTDARGRRIKIRKIGPLDRLRLFKAIGPVGSAIPQYVGYATLAASVISIDGSIETLPRSEAQIEAMVERLGDDGLASVATAHAEHFVDGEDGDPAAVKK
jgi:hypothetical protein